MPTGQTSVFTGKKSPSGLMGGVVFFIIFIFISRGNRHPLPPPLAQNVKSARQKRTEDAPN